MFTTDTKTILLVEDEFIIAATEKMQLEKAGYRVIHAGKGALAIDIVVAAKERIDLILMDIDLGSGMDGTEAATEILRHRPLPILFLSSHTEKNIVQRTEDIGSYGYVVKNSSFTVLDASIKMAFRLHAAQLNIQAQKIEIETAYMQMQVSNEELESANQELIRYQRDILAHEDSLMDSERRLRDIIEFLPDATLAIDENERLIVWNKAIETMTGIPAEDMLGKGDSQYALPFYGERHPMLIDFHDDTHVDERYYNVRREGETMSAEAFCPALYGGRGAQVFIKSSPLHDREGRLTGWIESVRDISAAKLAMERIRESEERYKSFISVTNTGAWEYYSDTDYLWCSPEYFNMLGYEPTEFDTLGGKKLREAWIDLLHPEDREKSTRVFAEYLAGGSMGMYENRSRLKHKDGHWVWIWSRAQTMPDADGRPSKRIVGTHIDITASKVAEDALRESEQRFRMVFDNAPLGLLHFDAAGKIVNCNDRFVGSIGATKNRVLGLDMTTLPDKKLVSAVRSALSGVPATYDGVYHAVTVDTRTPIRMLFAPILSESGTCLGGVGIIERTSESAVDERP